MRLGWICWPKPCREGVYSLLSFGKSTCSGTLGPAVSQLNPWDSHLALGIELQASGGPHGLLNVSQRDNQKTQAGVAGQATFSLRFTGESGRCLPGRRLWAELLAVTCLELEWHSHGLAHVPGGCTRALGPCSQSWEYVGKASHPTSISPAVFSRLFSEVAQYAMSDC